MPDLNFQDISTVQNDSQQAPVTITAAATIAPKTFLTTISGTTAVATITPPVSGSHMLAFRFATTDFVGFVTSGNVALASLTNSTFWTNKLVLMVYNQLTAKYYPNYPYPVAATNL